MTGDDTPAVRVPESTTWTSERYIREQIEGAQAIRDAKGPPPSDDEPEGGGE